MGELHAGVRGHWRERLLFWATVILAVASALVALNRAHANANFYTPWAGRPLYFRQTAAMKFLMCFVLVHPDVFALASFAVFFCGARFFLGCVLGQQSRGAGFPFVALAVGAWLSSWLWGLALLFWPRNGPAGIAIVTPHAVFRLDPGQTAFAILGALAYGAVTLFLGGAGLYLMRAGRGARAAGGG